MAKRTDSNQAEIVKALRAVGASVESLHTVGKGVPDLLCGFRGSTFLLEVKTSTGKLRPSQIDWRGAWYGHQPITVHSVDQALAAIGAV